MSKYPPVKVGNRYGRLVVLSPDTDKGWLCKCDCGNTKSVCSGSLRRGATKSCGCLKKEKTAITGANRRIKNPYKVLKDKIEVKYKDRVFYISKESEWILRYSWRINKSGYVTTFLYDKIKQNFIHQLLLKDELSKPENENKMIDHIDGNPLNNCLDNLRIVSNRQNCLNTKKRKDFGIYKTIYKNNRYQVLLGKNNKPIYLGTFDTIEEARAVRDKWIDENDRERYEYNRK